MCALKADREELATDLSYYMNHVQERGVVVVHSTGGSGAAMDQAAAIVGTPSGIAGVVSGSKPAGLLLNDVVNLDLTRQHLNGHRDEVQVNGKVLLLKRGWVVTNQVSGTPTIGASAYYDYIGRLAGTDPGNGVVVGAFRSRLDADGYAKVEINIP